MTEDLQRFQAQSLGEQVKSIRKRLGMSQAELARRLGISQAAVSEMEKAVGTTMRADTRTRLADALGVQLVHGQLVPPWMGGAAVAVEMED